MKIAIVPFLALVAPIACVALVGTIEILNHQTGDAIGLKQRQEPHSKWRLPTPGFKKRVAEMEFRQEREIPGTQPLTPEQATEVERLAHEVWDQSLPHYRLARVMRNYSAWGVPSGLLALVLGIALRTNGTLLRVTYCSIGALTLLITCVRYIPSLGW